jgi:DNA integrity scanning protein DisA with diadenylate cyclase activity
LAFQAALAALESTSVVPVSGTGSRHLSAQKISKETDAICIVVSQDGPITIFVNGEVAQRYFV